jgi:hypothetical protein
MSWRTRPILCRLVDGGHFVCWHYSEDEWARHLAVDRKRYLPVTALMAIFIAAILIMIGVGQFIEIRYREAQGLPALMLEGWRQSAVPLLIPIGIMLAAGMIYDALGAWYRRAMDRAARCAYIGAECLYFSGKLVHADLRQGWKLTWVEGERSGYPGQGEQSSLRFEYLGYKNQQMYQIPVPTGREAEGLAVLEKVRNNWPLDQP